MTDVTHYLVPAVLTDAQDQAFEDAVNSAGNTADGFRAIGTLVSAGGMEVVGFTGSRTFGEWDPSSVREIYRLPQKGDDIALVCQSDAVAQIAIRDTKIAELTARLGTIAQETRDACARIFEEKRDDIDREYGAYDPSTGVTELPEHYQTEWEIYDDAVTALRSTGEKA